MSNINTTLSAQQKQSVRLLIDKYNKLHAKNPFDGKDGKSGAH